MTSRKLSNAAHWCAVVAMVLIASVVVTIADPLPVEAGPPAPTSPQPVCIYDVDGDPGLGCAPGGENFGAGIEGTFDAGGEFTIVTNADGLAPCATYVSTGCYYDLYTPSLVRCVYLENGDPTDVRSCGSLSTTGSVIAQRQGTCSGTLGSTYATGGPGTQPDTWWSARAPRLARCLYTVSGTNKIDNLRGPTFYLVRTSVDECIEPGGGYGCDEYWATLERHEQYAWLPVTGTLAPAAKFNARATADPATFTFENVSVPYDGTTTYEWDFGDAGTSTATSPSHTYQLPGEYRVRLTMRGPDGQSQTASKWVEVEPPALFVSVQNLDADLGPDGAGNRIKLGESFTTRVTLNAVGGVGDLHDVRPTPELLDLPAQLEVEEFPVMEPFGMVDGQTEEFEVEVTAVAPGNFTLPSRWLATDDAGSPIDPAEGSFNGKVTGLSVTITPDPAVHDLKSTDPPLDIVATVTITNETDSVDFTDVNLQGPLEWAPLDDEETLADVHLVHQDLEALTEAFGNDGIIELGELGPGESKEYTYDLVADGNAFAELQQLVTAATADGQLNELGTGDLKVGGLLLEFDADVVTPVLDNLLPAGQAIRVEGSVKNISDKVITVGPPAPEVSGNAGAMSVVWDPTGKNPDPIDVEIPALRVLQPDEEIDFLVRITTAWSDPRLYGVEPSGGTYAELEFTPWGSYVEESEKVYFGTEKVSATDEELKHRVSIDDSIEIPEFDPLDYASGLYVGAFEGLGKATVGLVTGVVETPWAVYSTMSSAYDFIERTWSTFTPEEQAEFSEDAAYAAAAFMLRSVDVAKQDFDQTWQQANGMVYQSMTEMANEWETGDYVGTTRIYTSYAGEGIGSIIIPIGLAKLAKYPRVATALERGDALIRAKAAPILAKVRQTLKVDDLYEHLMTLPNGAVLDPEEVRRLYGIAPDELAELQQLADDLGYMITVRSRHPSSIEWIRGRHKAVVKPEAIKVKSVSELDLKLGYDTATVDGDSPLGAVILKKPGPIKQFEQAGGDLNDHIHDFVVSKGFTPDTVEYQSAVARMNTRVAEWNELSPGYFKAHRAGKIDTTYDYQFNSIPPEVAQGTKRMTGFRLEPVPGQEDTFVVQLMDKDNRFRPVTGDIDAIAFTKADGSPLTPTEHAELLVEVQENPKLAGQHGDSVTGTADNGGPGGLDFIGKQFKGEPGLQLAPNAASPRVVRYNKGKSRWASARDFNIYWDGGFVQIGRSLQNGLIQSLRVVFGAKVVEEVVKAFTLEPAPRSEPNVGRCRVTFSDADAAPAVIGTDAGLAVVGADGTVSPSPLQQQCFSEGPTVDVAVKPASSLTASVAAADRAADVAAAPPGEIVERAIETESHAAEADTGPSEDMSTGAAGSESGVAAALDPRSAAHSRGAGSTSLAVAHPGRFRPGDVVVVGAGTERAEVVTVERTSPFVVSPALRFSHDNGALIVTVESAPAGGPGEPDPDDDAEIVPVSPARLLETRSGNSTVDGKFLGAGRVAGGSVTEVVVTGRGGVPVGALAVMLNVTVVAPDGAGHVTVFPCGEATPTASNLNYRAGQVVPNAVLAKVGAGGKVCLYSHAGAHLIVDVNGYVPAGSSVASVSPARLLETRSGNSTVDGKFLGAGRVAGGSVTEVVVTGRGGVPVGALAVMLNVTVVAPDGAGHVTVFPCGEATPTASNLNYRAGQVVPNAVLAKVGAGGKVCLYSHAGAHLIVDVNGYVP